MRIAEAFPRRLAEWRPEEGRQTLTAAGDDETGSVALTVDRHETLGSLVWELSVGTAGAAPSADLADWAGRVASALVGLREPIDVYEIDARRNEALLRSRQPEVVDGQVSYFEAHLVGCQRVLLRRYRASTQPGTPRQQISFAVTQETLTRIVGNLLSDPV